MEIVNEMDFVFDEPSNDVCLDSIDIRNGTEIKEELLKIKDFLKMDSEKNFDVNDFDDKIQMDYQKPQDCESNFEIDEPSVTKGFFRELTWYELAKDCIDFQPIVLLSKIDSVATRNKNREKTFECLICPSKFASMKNLKRHVETVHEKKKPFQCSICPSKFAEKIALKRHILSVHKGKRSYHCSFCPAKFNLNENLNRHYDKIHENKNPHECSICFTTLSSTANLKRHYDTVHEKKKPYECSICFKKFGEKGNLNHHSRFVHEEKQPLNFQPRNAKFDRKQFRENYEKNKSRKCSVCQNKLSIMESMEHDVAVIHEGEKPIECSTCSARSSQLEE